MSSDPYKNKTRIRVCGLLVEDDQLLLAEIRSPVTNSDLWMPPGGGLSFGETLEEALQREFAEETGVKIQCGRLLGMEQLIEPPYHAIEFYFAVTRLEGTPSLGYDPEHEGASPVLQDLQWIPIGTLAAFNFKPEALPGWARAIQKA